MLGYPYVYIHEYIIIIMLYTQFYVKTQTEKDAKRKFTIPSRKVNWK